MNKISTDLEQSKKLAEILSIESADMEYLAIKDYTKCQIREWLEV